MRKLLVFCVLSCTAVTIPAVAADPPAVRLFVKPLLCVIDQDAAGCSMNFDIRWKSLAASEYCLHDSAAPTPLRCWPRLPAGQHVQQREVTEDFIFWLAPPGEAQRVAEVKVEVLRVGSPDRRRERRSRHIWDVL
jgi:hypothetical protein